MKKILSIFIVAAMVLAIVPFTAMAAVHVDSVSNAQANVDFVYGDSTQLIATGGGIADQSITFTKGTYSSVAIAGWYTSNEALTALGYSIDGGSVTYDASFVGDSRGDVASIYGYTYANSINARASISDLAVGTHTVVFYVKSASVEAYFFNLTVVINEPGAREESVPTLKDTSIFSEVGATFQEAVYTEGYNLNEHFTSDGNVVRNHWTPQFITQGNGLVIAVDGTNKYVTSSGYTQFFSDYRWQGGYEFSCKYAGFSSSGAVGIHLNYSNEGRAAALFEYNGTAGIGAFSALTGNTGIYIVPTSANTVSVVIYTYDYSKANSGADGDYNAYVSYISADFTLDGVDLSTLTSFSAKDSGTGKIELYFGNAKFATVKYGGDGLYGNNDTEADCPFYERYYKTASICDATGATVVSTNAALISYYKTVGFGDRVSNTLCFDDLALATYTAPAATVDVTTAVDVATAEPGDQITVSVVLGGEASIISARGTIAYDATALTYNSYSLGTVFSAIDTAASVITAADGVINLLMVNNELADVAGAGTLIKLTFTVNADAAEGSYAFTFTPSADDDTFCDLNEDDYDCGTITTGSVTVTAPVVEETPTLALVSGSAYTIDTTKGLIVIDSAASNAAFLANLTTSTGTGTIVLKNPSGTVVSTGRATGTGYIVELQFNGAVIETYVVSFIGDINSDGKITSLDVVRLNTDIVSNSVSGYSVALKYAANTNKDTRGSVTAADLVKLVSYVADGTW